RPCTLWSPRNTFGPSSRRRRRAVTIRHPPNCQSVILRPPSVPAVIFAVVAIATPIALGNRLLNADGDIARHLRHGLTMLERGGLIRHDPFSYTRPGEPFLAFEYGSQLLGAAAHQVGGLAAVAILAGAVIAAAYALVARFLIRQ